MRREPEDPWDRILGWIDDAAEWPRRGRSSRRLIALAAGLAAIALLAVLVSRISWREDVPRSTIAAIAIALAVLLALWLFGSRGSGTAVGVLAALGAILVAAGASLDWNKILGSGSPPEGAVVDCPDLPSDPEFTGVVAPTELGYTHVRLQAGFSDVDARYPPGCELAFDGYCLGAPKDDWRFDTQDPVWFRLAEPLDDGGRGYVASADLKAGPPRVAPADGNAGPLRYVVAEVGCGTPEPTRPEITSPLRKRLTGPVEFTAAAPTAIQVGFAVNYDHIAGAKDSTRAWHQIGIDLNTGDGVGVSWDSRSVPGQRDGEVSRVTLVVVPCLGLEFPGRFAAKETYLIANHARRNAKATPAERPVVDAGAREEACNNSDR